MDGNLCRCTGYRPILAAFKTFVPDADENTQQIIQDIEVRRPAARSTGWSTLLARSPLGYPAERAALGDEAL